MLEYFKDKLNEELCGAKEYVKLALEFKATNPNWSKMLIDMSSAELNHATNLYKMAEESYTSTKSVYNETPKYIKEIWDCIATMYLEKTAKVKFMQETYAK